MPKNSIGDFFVTIASVIDKASFETSNRLVDGLGNSFNKLIGSAANAANTLAQTTLDTAKVGDSVQKLSAAWDISTESINLWRATAKIATTDAKSLDNALSKLSDVQNSMRNGAGFDAFSEGLSMLAMSYDDLDGLDIDKQLETILNHALKLNITGDIATTDIALQLENLLGQGARETFLKLVAGGFKDVASYQNEKVTSRIFTSNEDYLNLEKFQEQVNIFDQSIDSLKTLFGSTLAKNLTDPLSNLNDWLVAHGDDIALAMDKLGTAIGKIIGNTIDFINDEETQETIGELVDGAKDVFEGSKKIIEGVGKGNAKEFGEGVIQTLGGAGNAIEAVIPIDEQKVNAINQASAELAKQQGFDSYGEYLIAHPIMGNFTKINFDDLSPELQTSINKIRETAPEFMPAIVGTRKQKNIKDGIISPTGQVTQVAPDDWVFAARNIGDMARAFIPQNYNSVSAPSEYSIVQNFTINGGNDMPQVLRQQAYQGTQDAMLQMLEQSARRLQLMSGTR